MISNGIRMGHFSPWADPQAIWYLKQTSNSSTDFWIVSGRNSRNPNQMLYLEADGSLSMFPFWPDQQAEWQLKSNDSGRFWIVSGNRQRQPNAMLYHDPAFDDRILSHGFWEDPVCLWVLATVSDSFPPEARLLVKADSQRGGQEAMFFLPYPPLTYVICDNPDIGQFRAVKALGDWNADGLPETVFYSTNDIFIVGQDGTGKRIAGSPFAHNTNCDPTPNGCTWVPEFNFTAVCDRHDIAYAKGGREADRIRADEDLRDGIKESSKLLAEVYYIGVRTFGASNFCYRNSGGEPISREESRANERYDGSPRDKREAVERGLYDNVHEADLIGRTA